MSVARWSWYRVQRPTRHNIGYVISDEVFRANHLTDTDKQNSAAAEIANNAKYSKQLTTLVQSPLTTLGQERDRRCNARKVWTMSDVVLNNYTAHLQ